MNSSAATDLHIRCLTPDFAAALFNRLRGTQHAATGLVGTVVIVPADGTDTNAAQVRSLVRSIGVAPESAVHYAAEPQYLRQAA